VASGTPELVLVSGYSGIGKSSVVNEPVWFHRAAFGQASSTNTSATSV
jgi:predicted ATPase